LANSLCYKELASGLP